MWMETKSQPISCCSKMALLGRIKTPQNQPSASNYPCKKQRRKKNSKWDSKITGRRLRRTNMYRLRVSRLFLPRLSRLLPKLYHETPHSSESNHACCPAKTRMKIQQLTALGYRVKEMWECEWNGVQKTDPQLKAFIDKLDIVSPLNPRGAFFGSRTNAIKLHHKVDENEKIEYRDIISLYPCANLECNYPICHPEFIDQPRTRHLKILWINKMQNSTSLWAIPSSSTMEVRIKTTLPVVQNMRATKHKTSTPRKKRQVPPFCWGKMPHRYLDNPGTTKSHWKVIYQKRVRVFHQGFQTLRNRWKH